MSETVGEPGLLDCDRGTGAGWNRQTLHLELPGKDLGELV